MSQPRYTLTNDQLMMLLKKQNKPKLRHSANVGKTLKDTSATHNNDILGMTSYFFISTVSEQNEWVVDSGAIDHMCGPQIKLSNIRTLPNPLEFIYPTPM